jgi:hypothetical protein
MVTAMADDLKDLSSPAKIVGAGEKIYAERHQATLERDYPGQFAAIDVTTGEVYVERFPEEALDKARAATSTGIFHLIRIGSSGAYHVSHLLHGTVTLAR